MNTIDSGVGRRRGSQLIRKVRQVLVVLIVLFAVVAMATLFGALTSRDRSVLFGRSESISVQGEKRRFQVSAPSDSPNVVVIALHGYQGNGRQFAYYTALHNAFGSDAAVVYPDAIAGRSSGEKPGWNAQFCCGSGWKKGTDDVAFIRALITQLGKRFGVGPDRVFLVGFSNGSFMAQRFAAEHPDLIGGVVAVSGTIGTTKGSLKLTAPVPVLLTHGAKDERVMYKGGETPGDNEFDWRSFRETVEAWQAANKCKGDKPEVTRTASVIRSVYKDCAASLETIEYLDNAHKWDGWRLMNVWKKRPEASVEAAAFIDRVSTASPSPK